MGVQGPKGITFHNGKTVTADDVIASLQHHLGENSKSAAKSLLKEVATMKADGAETVVFELSGGNADFPYTLSDYHMPIMPKKDDGSVDWESGIRTGAYMLEKFTPGVSATFNKNPNYYKADKGWFDRVEFLSIKDAAARTNALLSGEIQYIDRCDLKTLDHAEAEPGHHRLRDHRLRPLHLRDERDAPSPSTIPMSATPSSIR